MWRKTFTLTTSLPPNDALNRIVQLLEIAGVRIEREEAGLRSLRTPLPLINLDPRLYSRRNWVGINPFALLTGLSVTMAAGSSAGALIDVAIDRRRVMLLLAFEALIVLSIAFRAPLPVTLAVAAVLLGFCAILLRWAHTLTRTEIERQLRP